MGLDKDDEIVKRRMAQKMQFLAEDVAAAREPTTTELKSWFDEHSAMFALPPRLSFRHLYFSPDRRGARAREDAAAGAREARRPARGRDDRRLARRSVHVPGLLPRPRARLSRQGVRTASSRSPSPSSQPGSWQGPIESGFGWHLVFVDTVIPGRVPAFEEIEPDVKTAWLSDQKARLGEGVQGHARQVHRAAARASRSRHAIVSGARSRTGKGGPASSGQAPLNVARSSPLRVSCCPPLALIVATLAVASGARAHEARPAYLEIKETAPGTFSVLWRTPVLAGMRLPVVLTLPDDVRNLKEPVVQELADSLVERRWIDAGPNGLAGKRIEFVGTPIDDHRCAGPRRDAGRQEDGRPSRARRSRGSR